MTNRHLKIKHILDEVLSISFIVFVCGIAGLQMVSTVVFAWQDITMNKIGCDLALMEASQASSIKLAKTKLNDAIKDSCKSIIAQRQNLGGIWYENLEQQLHTLENINKNATAEEKYYVLKHFKETLKELGH